MHPRRSLKPAHRSPSSVGTRSSSLPSGRSCATTAGARVCWI